jgi:antitoxin HicB
MEKSVEYYMNLPYTIELQRDPEEGWFVRVRELRGCMSQGDTPEEALEMIQEAMELWLEVALEDHLPIPEPRPDEDYSGKFVVRVPRSLHRELVQEAERQGASLNQYINVALARAVGRSTPTSSPTLAEEPGWPGLKAAVRQALLEAGLGREAAGLDERLFAGEMRALLASAKTAVDDAHLRSALLHLETMAKVVQPVVDKSPVLRLLLDTLKLLTDQVQRELIIEKLETGLQTRIAERLQRSTMAGDATRALSVGYSQASIELPGEEGYAVPLFNQPREKPSW